MFFFSLGSWPNRQAAPPCAAAIFKQSAGAAPLPFGKHVNEKRVNAARSRGDLHKAIATGLSRDYFCSGAFSGADGFGNVDSGS